MSGVNKAILLGHLGRDPEMRYMPDGTANATLNVATSETYKDRDGNKQERTEWHRAVFWGRTAEVAGEYLRKGRVYIEGRLRTRKWTDKEGQDRYTTEIVGDRLQMVGGRRDGGADDRDGHGGSGGGGGGMNPAPSDEFPDDDIPFILRADPAFQRHGRLRRVRF